MRTVAEHVQACLQAVGIVPDLDVVLPDAMGCVLAEDVTAGQDHPFVDAALLDGYAVASSDIASATPSTPVTLPVVADIHTGELDRSHLVAGTAARIASGAPVPIGADAVVPAEFTDLGEANVAVKSACAAGENVRKQAEDMAEGDVVLKAGTRIGAPQIALLAAVGRGRVRVHPKPRVVIISIGDELLEPGRERTPGQVFDANSHALACAAQDAGAMTYRVPAVSDERATLRQTITDQLVRSDLIITTGGLSYGKDDTIKDVLSPLGKVRFDQVAMWPGRQFGVGALGEEPYQVPIFCLPGDPVAVQVAFEAFVRPAIRAMSGYQRVYRRTVRAKASTSFYSVAGKREFVRVKVTGQPGAYQAEILGNPASLLISELAKANAYAVVPESTTDVHAGDDLTCMLVDG
ncbi:molybdopterin molybdenumtransferase MoeA [Bowdeniella nasicola]|uniref:Molybdopterin molybdenumtransferase n=1 Tax=Bowdeniella nasicola TaxID=208480 RepID=A0A1Q5Q4K7_9ACTO|nr:gephyrin-like molybdotransferase Glp [Bowdeniella nasicola]OKL54764.1 molybdopterin molybdenumtransferase MoeA [Bowdeniella nasicola]